MTDVDRLAGIRVVLVEPSHPGNIGGAARALKTMGLGQLALVRPKRFPDPQAEWRAAGAQDVLDAATVHESLASAIADCQWVVGTGMLTRRIPWPIRDATEAAAEMLAQPAGARVAVVFGRETSGLTNDELQRCHATCRFRPIRPTPRSIWPWRSRSWLRALAAGAERASCGCWSGIDRSPP
jgi:tRNA (cytidine32/uridine32-2'-O)-methyltransferase